MQDVQPVKEELLDKLSETWCLDTKPIYFLAVLEAKGTKSIQVLAGLVPAEVLGENTVSCLVGVLQAAGVL